VQTGGAPLARTCQGWESPCGSRGGSSKQIRMASKCGQMHPLGCGLNQGQGRPVSTGSVSSNEFDAFITSRVDYCNAVLARSPKSTTDTLQRVLNASARLVTNTDKYDCGLSSLLHDHLLCLSIADRIEYKLAVMVHQCLENKDPAYLIDHCIPVTAVSSRHL